MKKGCRWRRGGALEAEAEVALGGAVATFECPHGIHTIKHAENETSFFAVPTQGIFYLALDCCCARTASVGTGPRRSASRAWQCRLLGQQQNPAAAAAAAAAAVVVVVVVVAAAAAAAPRLKKQHRMTLHQTLPHHSPPIQATSATTPPWPTRPLTI